MTDRGHEVVETTVDAVLGREAELLDGLAADEQAGLAGLLADLLREVHTRLR